MTVDWDSAVIGPTVGVFGEAITFSPAAGSPFAATGVFDEEYLEMLPLNLTSGMTGAVSESRPVLGIQLSQFPVLPLQDDQVLIVRTGVTYTVEEARPDGHGGAKLLLNYASGP